MTSCRAGSPLSLSLNLSEYVRAWRSRCAVASWSSPQPYRSSRQWGGATGGGGASMRRQLPAAASMRRLVITNRPCTKRAPCRAPWTGREGGGALEGERVAFWPLVMRGQRLEATRSVSRASYTYRKLPCMHTDRASRAQSGGHDDDHFEIRCVRLCTSQHCSNPPRP